jgi:hypothetical protein
MRPSEKASSTSVGRWGHGAPLRLHTSVWRVPANSRTLGAPTATSKATLPSAYTSTADGVPLARIERDEIEPRITTLRKLAQGLEVDPAELVGD